MAMLTFPSAAAPPVLPSPLPLALQAFLAGILVALALLSILAYRPLRDRVLSEAGLFGLVAAAAWMAYSGLLTDMLPLPWRPGPSRPPSSWPPSAWPSGSG